MKPILIQGNEVGSVNGDILTKSVNLVYLLDYSSVYLSVLNNVDPSPVKAIEFVKSRLRKHRIIYQSNFI